MSSQDLTTLNNVKTWLSVSVADTNANDLFNRLISQASRGVLSHLQRSSLFLSTYTERFDGNGGSRIILPNWPVISVSALSVDGQALPPSPAPYSNSGYMLAPASPAPPGAPQALDLRGYRFGYAAQGVEVTYQAGYYVAGEAQTVPGAPYKITVAQTYGRAALDGGVTLGGVAMTAVTGAPAVGQYRVSEGGVYEFNAAQTGAAVLISYSYVPADVEQYVIEWIGERFKYRGRIGVETQTLGGQETQSYNLKAMPDYIKEGLQPYRRVTL